MIDLGDGEWELHVPLYRYLFLLIPHSEPERTDHVQF